MDNFEALRQMSREQLAVFLDYIYLTGLNSGWDMGRLPEDDPQREKLLEESPYGAQWLAAEAEPAARCAVTEDGEMCLPEAFVQAAMRAAQMAEEEEA